MFNEWAFRFIFPLEPINAFLRLMTLVVDAFFIIAILAFTWSNSSFSKRIKTLLVGHPRSVTLFFGLFFGYCVLMSVEFGCRYYFKYVYQPAYSENTEWHPSAVIPDSILGSKLPTNTVISHKYVANDSLIYHQHYRTDTQRRRVGPSIHSDSAYREFTIITGCSFAFGYGVNEQQTLRYFLDSLSGRRGYNYGIPGHGTQQTLALLQSRNLHLEIAEPNGVLVHLFIDDHIPRLIGSRRLMRLWAKQYPYYFLQDDALKRNGSFLTGRNILTRFYLAISQSAFIDLFDIELPWYVSNAHTELFGRVISEAKKEFLTQYPEGKFLVVIGPSSTLASKVSSVLTKMEVDFLDLSKHLDKKQPRYRIHWTESHPNGNYYLVVAQAIETHLGK